MWNPRKLHDIKIMISRSEPQEKIFLNDQALSLSLSLTLSLSGSSIDRVSGRQELLPSASEQMLSPLRFQETRGGSGVCHFGFKDQVLSVPVDLARGPMGLSSPAVHHYHLRQLRRSLRRPSSSSDARPAALATSRTAEDPALPCSLPDPGPDGLVHG